MKWFKSQVGLLGEIDYEIVLCKDGFHRAQLSALKISRD